jgi:hypothetical protein
MFKSGYSSRSYFPKRRWKPSANNSGVLHGVLNVAVTEISLKAREVSRLHILGLSTIVCITVIDD